MSLYHKAVTRNTMLRCILVTLALFYYIHGRCQVNADSLKGIYSFKTSEGGGFTGGPNGECMATPPDCRMTSRLIIGQDLSVAKTADTVWHTNSKGIRFNRGCDTLYIGKANIKGDTLIVRYNLKPICPDLFYVNPEKRKRYETLKRPLIEKYVMVQKTKHSVYALRKWKEEEEYFRKGISIQ